MSRAFFVRAYGGPEQMKLEDRVLDAPGPGQIAVRNHAIGLNFVDVYQRTGLYATPLPFVAGNEGAGEVTAVGPDVTMWKVGDRVAYSGPQGAYADERLLPADKGVPIPDGVSYETAAAALLKGTTAFYLLHWTHELKAGETILVHAAAGGTGLLLCQWAKAIGARVIGTAGSDEKLAVARENGCDEVINSHTDYPKRVRELTDGKGVDVVYDGVGKATFEGSLDCLRPRGLMVSFGNASGPVSVPSLGILAAKGSLYVTRPTGAAYFPTGKELQIAGKALFEMIEKGALRIAINQRFPLAQAVEAQMALEARQTTGQTLLIP
jgi:NADPH2:quinone reductase